MLLTEIHKLYKSQDKETYNIIYNLLLASKNLYNKANFYDFTIDDFFMVNYDPIKPQLKLELGI